MHLALDDFTKYLIKEALKLNRSVYLTAKDKGGAGSFLFESVYPKLFAELEQKLVIPTPAKLPAQHDTALAYARQYYDGAINTSNTAPVSMLEDGSIRFIGPFRNRHAESAYIVHEISRLLKESCGDDVRKLKKC